MTLLNSFTYQSNHDSMTFLTTTSQNNILSTTKFWPNTWSLRKNGNRLHLQSHGKRYTKNQFMLDEYIHLINKKESNLNLKLSGKSTQLHIHNNYPCILMDDKQNVNTNRGKMNDLDHPSSSGLHRAGAITKSQPKISPKKIIYDRDFFGASNNTIEGFTIERNIISKKERPSTYTTITSSNERDQRASKAKLSSLIFVGNDKYSDSIILCSYDLKKFLDLYVEWTSIHNSLTESLLVAANKNNKAIKIVAHGSKDSIYLGKNTDKQSIDRELSRLNIGLKLNNCNINLWSCYGGSPDGVAEIIAKNTGAKVYAAPHKLGNGIGIESLKGRNITDNAIQNIPIFLHTNSIGFDVIDNLNGTFGLVVYYAAWGAHSNYSNFGGSTEGALSLYTLKSGGNSSLVSDYTSEAYGQGGSVQNQTFLPSIPPKITGNINISKLADYVESNSGSGRTDLTDAGFTPGENYFFAKYSDSSTLYNYNSTNGSSAASGFQVGRGHQSIYIPSVTPGTYRPYYDGHGSWDSTNPVGANSITMNFMPISAIANALVTITGSGKLIFGAAPKIFINSVDNDNGSSETDFVTTGRNIVIRGSYSNVESNDENSIKVKITNKATSAITEYSASDSELSVDASGGWVLSVPGTLSAANYDIEASIISSATTYTANQDLNIVSASIQKISNDDGVSSTDFKTSDQTLLIEGIYSSATATGLTISVLDASNNAIISNQNPTSSVGDSWEYDLTGTTLSVGSYTIEVTVSDNSGSSKATQALVIQSLPPAPTVTSISDDTGTAGDFITTDTTLLLSGSFDKTLVTSKTDGELRVSLGGNTYTNTAETLTVDYTAGTWSFNSKTLSVGQYNIQAEIIDTNGLYNSGNKTLVITDPTDNTPPTTPTISSIDTDTDTAGDFITTDQSISIHGTYDASDALGGLSVSFGGITYQLGSDTALTTSGNNWTLTVPGKAESGTATVNATDGGGNTSSASQAITIQTPPTGSVTISGTATQAQQLTAANTLADANGLGTISYQWKRAGSAISGATSSTYTLVQADVGSAITVTASYTDGLGKAESVTSSATSAVANINDSPSGSVTISGTPTEDQTLTASNTLADADGLGTISYQWSRAGSAISGATSSTYTLVQADVGSAITVTASYTDDQGTAESVTSSATSAVANINDVPTGSLSISGTAQDNAELTASHTLVDPDGLGVIDYQWRRNGSLIPVAITNKYVLTKCDVGAAITVSAQYTDGYGASESVASSATSVVTSDNASSSRLNASSKASATCINSSPTGLVRLSGTARENEVLTATNTLDDADGLGSITYQWNRNRASISGSTGSTYALTQADVGSSITVTASYTDGSGRSERMTSTTEYLVANADNPAVVTGNLSGTGVINGDPITGSLAATDLDGLTNGTIYSIQSNDQAANGSATIDSLSGSWRYLAKDDFAGTDNFFVSISDDLGGITRQLIDLTISGSEQSTPTPTPTPTPSPAPSSGAGGSGSGGGPALTPTPDALGDLKTKKSAPSPSQQVNDSSDTVINGLNSSEWSSLRKTEIRRLTANQLQSLSGQALALFKPAKIKAIGHDAVSGINAKAINQLSTRQVQAIRAKGLTSQQLSQFSLDTFKALKTKQFRQITPDAITGLTSRHLKTLSGKELSAFKPASFKAIDPDEISHLEPNALDDLKKRQVKAITDDQLAGLSQRQIKTADDFIEMLSNQQLQILSIFPDL